MKVTVIVLLVLLTLLLAIIGWIARQPHVPMPRVSIRLVGYTNTAHSGRLAVFALTNAGPATANHRSSFGVYVQNIDGQRVKVGSGQFPGGRTKLRPGTSEFWSVVPPTNQLPWQVSLSFSADESPIRDFAAVVLDNARELGMRARYYQPRYYVRSEWIDSKQSLAD